MLGTFDNTLVQACCRCWPFDRTSSMIYDFQSCQKTSTSIPLLQSWLMTIKIEKRCLTSSIDSASQAIPNCEQLAFYHNLHRDHIWWITLSAIHSDSSDSKSFIIRFSTSSRFANRPGMTFKKLQKSQQRPSWTSGHASLPNFQPYLVGTLSTSRISQMKYLF